MQGSEKQDWLLAAQKEIQHFDTCSVWTLIDRSDIKIGKHALKTRWIWKKKDNNKFKAWLVVKGYKQIPGVDFTESFSPVANDTTIRTALAIALHQGWIVESIDVEAAFLNADLEEEVHIEIPDGYPKAQVKRD